MAQHTRPDAATQEEEEREARAEHVAGRDPSADEAEAADSVDFDPDTAKSYRGMTKRGAEQKGEGRLP